MISSDELMDINGALAKANDDEKKSRPDESHSRRAHVKSFYKTKSIETKRNVRLVRRLNI